MRHSADIHLQPVTLNKRSRGQLKGHRPCVVWLTGLPGAGKSTLADLLEARLHDLGCHTYLLDGDNVRHGINRDLGFSDADRTENVRRVGEIAKLMVDAGLIVIVALISPFAADRHGVRRLLGEGEFLEVHVDVPLEVAEKRDPKGLYRRARRGELKGLTGVDAPYEAPRTAELRIDTSTVAADEATRRLLDLLRTSGILSGPLPDETPVGIEYI